jgi:hypothetical protein
MAELEDASSALNSIVFGSVSRIVITLQSSLQIADDKGRWDDCKGLRAPF